MLGYTRHVSIKFTNRGPNGAAAEFVIVGRKHNNLAVDLVTQQGDLVTIGVVYFGSADGFLYALE